MPHTVRVNLANSAELLELPGVGPEQLVQILRPWPVAEAIWERVDFAPAETTAPEAPGA
jgi:hypothetical protein